MPQAASPSKKALVSVSRHIIKLPQQQQQQKLSYQTNKLAQYIQLQLSDLENTLHYIQKKHSINQIKQSISHSYNIFSQTQPIFRELRINFVYQKIKKLVNCFSIIYLILIQHIEKPLRISVQSDSLKINQGQTQPYNGYEQSTILKKITSTEKKNTANHLSQLNDYSSNFNGGVKKVKPLGGIHLYNQQYNRHIQSDLDRLKRKLKEQAREIQQSQNPKLTQKQRLKQQIFKQINTDIYGSPSPDELTLFFNLNCNRYGSQLQYLTFQDQLQEIAAFFKQSQDEALQFLNKSRDQFIFLNFNEGFKEALTQYKAQKQQQVNSFVVKVKNLFQMVKFKTLQKQNELNLQFIELKRLQEKINKPITFQMQTQTSFNFQQQISRLKKKYQQLQSNYIALRDFKKDQNQNGEKNLTYLQHKIAFKDHEITIIKKQLDQKSHFIDFLNQKINQGTDPKLLRKISNLYRNHTKKNSSKLKIELQLLQKQVGVDLNSLKNKKSPKNDSQIYQKQNKKTDGSEQSQSSQLRRSQKKNLTTPIPQYEKSPAKRKRKPGISFFNSPDKKFASFIQRNASFNLQNSKIQEANSQMERATSEDIPLFQQKFQQNQQEQTKDNLRSEKKINKEKKNLVKNDKRKVQQRNSLQVVQKNKQKKFEPKRSAFAGSFGNKFINKTPDSQRTSKIQSVNQNNISQESQQNYIDEEQMLIQQINRLGDFKDHQSDDNQQSNSENSQFQSQIQNLNECQGQEKRDRKQFKSKQQLKIWNEKFKNSRYMKNMKVINGKQSKQNILNSKQNQQGIDQQQLTIQKGLLTKQKGLTQAQQNPNHIQTTVDRNKSQKVKSNLKKNYSNHMQSMLQVKQNAQPSKRFQSFQTNSKIMNDLKNNNSQRLDQNQVQQIGRNENNKLLWNNDKLPSTLRNQNLGNQLESQYNLQNHLNKPSSKQNQQINNRQLEQNKIIYYKNLYKQQKIKSTHLNSKIIDIHIAPQEKSTVQVAKPSSKLQNQVPNSNKQNSNKKNNILPLSNKSQYLSIFNKTKNSSSGSLSDFYKSKKGKLSQLPPGDSLLKFRDHKIVSQNIIQNLTTFHQINPAQEMKQEVDTDSNLKKQQQNTKTDLQKDQSKKKLSSDVKNNPINQYERIYGICSNSDMRYQNQNSIKQRMEDYLQKNAARIALKCKNIEQFKSKIRKAHMSKCGQNCKHLERYIENFGRYKSNNRQILKIHIQNVNHSISHNQLNQKNTQLSHQKKETVVNFPVINPSSTFNSFNNNNSNSLNNTSSSFKGNLTFSFGLPISMKR